MPAKAKACVGCCSYASKPRGVLCRINSLESGSNCERAMALKLPDDQKGPSRWAARLALFSAALTATALIAHRVFGMSTPVAINVIGAAVASAVVALGFGLWSTVRIWRRGTGGGLVTMIAILLAAGLAGWPLIAIPASRGLPAINDVTTDTQSPPKFTIAAKARPAGANPVNYPGPAFALLQSKSYPDIRTFQIDRSTEDAYELVLAALNSKTMKLKPVSEQPPKKGQPGTIEIVDRTLVLGLTDDIVIRIDGDDKVARIDVRSSSRYGSHDFGRNAQRVRRILKEVQAVVEATTPNSDGHYGRLRGRLKALVPKRRPESGQTSAGPRNGQALSKSDAQRAPAQKDRPPSRDGRRAPDTRG